MKDTVFQQLLKPITKKLIDTAAQRFQSDYHCKSFNTSDHLLALIYTHLHKIKSLRTLETALSNQLFGIKNKVKRSTLSDANSKRPVDCFAWILEQLTSLLPRKPRKGINKVVRVLDSSPIQLRDDGHDWAKQYSTRHIVGLKLHAEYDVSLQSPTKIKISYPNVNDASMGQKWRILQNTIYVFDKGYYDYNWWWSIHQKRAYFVTRLKKNAAITIEKKARHGNEFPIEDVLFKISNKIPRGGKRMEYRETLRYIKVPREGKSPLVLVTNLKKLPAEKIAALYKARWDVELFFKWIKQHLRIKKFLGKSLNAIKLQLIAAIITYVLIYLFKQAFKDNRSLYLVLTWIQHHAQTIKPYPDKPPTYRYPMIDRRFVQL
jgi:DDE family transposase/uncharacterized protein DUF4372